jgi:hypothetical protein
MRLLFDGVRSWGNDQGMRFLHLGGGMGADPNDSLLHFKLGFSDQTHEFATWRWILFPERYDRLCNTKTLWNERLLLQNGSPGFFPAYRAPPIVKRSLTVTAEEEAVASTLASASETDR